MLGQEVENAEGYSDSLGSAVAVQGPLPHQEPTAPTTNLTQVRLLRRHFHLRRDSSSIQPQRLAVRRHRSEYQCCRFSKTLPYKAAILIFPTEGGCGVLEVPVSTYPTIRAAVSDSEGTHCCYPRSERTDPFYECNPKGHCDQVLL